MRTSSSIAWCSALLRVAASSEVDYTQYVNPFMGGAGPYEGLAYGGGDIFVGAALPFGVVKVGLDTYEPNISFATNNGGWTPQGYVTGISMMHVSGTGGTPKYGLIAQMPLAGSLDAPVNVLDNRTYWQTRVGDDVARVGYFRTQLASGVGVEISGTRHAGIMRYTYPTEKHGDGAGNQTAGSSRRHVLVDASHYLPDEGGAYAGQVYLGGSIGLNSNGTRYTGHGTYGGGWNEGAPFTVFFCGEFDTAPDTARTFRGRNTDPAPRYHVFSNEPFGEAVFSAAGTPQGSDERSGPLNDRVGAVFSWDATTTATVTSRVGISMISTEKACRFVEDEVPHWDLNATARAAVAEWNSDVLSKVRVPTDPADATYNRTYLSLLYSSLYFTHLMPSNRTGENPLWGDEGGEPSWDDFYTLWDIFRCTVSLYHLLQPVAYEGMVRALIDIWRWEGYMPDGRSGNYNGLVQGGSNADNVLADAYVKGLRGGINWTDGYRAMVKNAEVTPYNAWSGADPTASNKEGRGALGDWHALGYVSLSNTRSLSRTVEYALNDYALSVVAAGEALDKDGDVAKYLNRSAGWQRLWNPNVTDRGFSGFLTPRFADGRWNATGYHPGLCDGCEWRALTYEGTPWEYSFTTPHDMETLIEFMGGVDGFEKRLDYIFQPNTSEQSLSANGAGITTIMNIGNEPDFATPYLYNYINKQYQSVNRSRALANEYFRPTLDGVPGNSDAGALNSWLVWHMLGLYPVVTQPVYLLESPWFADINMTVGVNATLRIRTKTNAASSSSSSSLGNTAPSGLGQAGYYVQAVEINGKPWDKNWFNHDDVMVHGGTIDFTVGDEPVVWETGPVPPSPGHYVLGAGA